MNKNQRLKIDNIEITDLIEESVSNAIERKNHALAKIECLSELSDTEMNNIFGGDDHPVCTSQTMGYFEKPSEPKDPWVIVLKK